MENRLTDEEVWLRAYCAAMTSYDTITPHECRIHARAVLQMFRDEFRNNQNNERTE